MAGFDKNKYDQQYKKDNFDHIAFFAPKGTKEKINAKAQSKGISVSEYMRNLISKDLENAE